MFGLALLAFFSCLGNAADDAVVVSVSGKFEDVKDNVRLAIEAQGLVINSVSNVGQMLERTGAELGKSRRIYGHGELFEFCSAKVSRQMMEVDAVNLVFCPFTIAVYTLPEQPAKVFVGYRKPPADPAFVPVVSLLKAIVAEAVH
jgi:uncharacterized protein (DUF302 family)